MIARIREVDGLIRIRHIKRLTQAGCGIYGISGLLSCQGTSSRTHQSQCGAINTAYTRGARPNGDGQSGIGAGVQCGWIALNRLVTHRRKRQVLSFLTQGHRLCHHRGGHVGAIASLVRCQDTNTRGHRGQCITGHRTNTWRGRRDHHW